VTGVIIQPLIGQSSDRMWTRLSRRRPFILGGAILASIVLLLMPNCSSVWMAAGLLWVLDGTINASMQPFRALVEDMEHLRRIVEKTYKPANTEKLSSR
jgi:maltose/moltooligosaccharide transporter